MPEHGRDPDDIMHILEDWTDMQLEGFFRCVWWGGWKEGMSPWADSKGESCGGQGGTEGLTGMLLGWPPSPPAARSTPSMATQRSRLPTRPGAPPPPRAALRCRDLVGAMQEEHALGRLLVFDIPHERLASEEQKILGVNQVQPCLCSPWAGPCGGLVLWHVGVAGRSAGVWQACRVLGLLSLGLWSSKSHLVCTYPRAAASDWTV